MKSRSLYFAAAFLLVLAVLPFLRSRPPSLSWEDNLQRAFALSRERQQLVVAYLYTDWCGYCRQLEATTLKDPQVIQELGDRFVWLRLNAEKSDDGVRLREQFGVAGFPAVFLLDSEEEEIERIEGYVPPDEFRRRLHGAGTALDSLATLRRNAAESPNSAEAHFRLGEKYMQRRDFARAVEPFARVAQIDPDNSSGRTDASLYKLAECLAMQNNPAEALSRIEALQARFPQSLLIPETQLLRAEILLYSGQSQEARGLLAEFLEENPQHERAPQIRELLASRQ